MMRLAMAVALAIGLAGSAACRAGDDPPAAVDPADQGAPASAAATPPAADTVQSRLPGHGQASHRGLAQGIDQAVRRLTRALDLDAAQQLRLRQILLDQHRQIMAIRNGQNPAAQSDMAGTSLAIYDQTKARIRAILNDEQRQKYAADVPRGELAPAQADLQHWLDVQDAARRQGTPDEGKK